MLISIATSSCKIMKLQWMWIFLSLALCLPDIVPASSEKKNDGSTVTAMLARIGLGPLSRCYKVGGAVEHEGPCLQLGLEKNLPECWGYEKNCSREKSLFVPHCDPPAQPWYVTTIARFICSFTPYQT